MNEQLRLRVLERDRYRCRGCAKAEGELHHIIFRSHGGLDTDENLITLCRNCHDMAHGKRNGKLPAWVLQALIEYNKWRACCGLWKEFERRKNCLTCYARSSHNDLSTEGNQARCLIQGIDIVPLDGCDQWRLRELDVHT